MNMRLAVGVGALLVASNAFGAGADITHREIPDMGHYGPVGQIHAYSWGSNTCNIGSTSLSWVSGGTPGLAMNAYRLHNGVLFQIGIGNAKTACCVGNSGGPCGTCTTGGFGLRPGCQDTYGQGFNAGQSRLAPRSLINPFTGVHTAIPSGTGDAVWRRCQINAADMNATTYPGALYFAEGVYVCLEETPDAKWNNATHRRATVANTGASPTFNWTPAEASTPGQVAAIYAWRNHGLGLNQVDPSVRIVTADVPSEGRFIVGGKATQVSTNPPRWRYDYAVFNLSSHRSGGSLTVSTYPVSVSTDVGFHDINYHSGEAYAATDWINTNEMRGVTWSSPQTFAQNQNTNALRWGTMYNYWFTSDAAPAASLGSVSLGLFRPGTPDSISIGGLPVPGMPPCIADYDNGTSTGFRDGSVGLEDLTYYLQLFDEGSLRGDVDDGQGGLPDSGVGIEDLLRYLSAYSGGC